MRKKWRRRIEALEAGERVHTHDPNNLAVPFRLPPYRDTWAPSMHTTAGYDLPPTNLTDEELVAWYDARSYVCDCSHFEEFHDPDCIFCECQAFHHTDANA